MRKMTRCSVTSTSALARRKAAAEATSARFISWRRRTSLAACSQPFALTFAPGIRHGRLDGFYGVAQLQLVLRRPSRRRSCALLRASIIRTRPPRWKGSCSDPTFHVRVSPSPNFSFFQSQRRSQPHPSPPEQTEMGLSGKAAACASRWETPLIGTWSSLQSECRYTPLCPHEPKPFQYVVLYEVLPVEVDNVRGEEPL